MLYDFEYYRPSLYRPRYSSYYSSYTPTYYSSYYPSLYSPWYRYPSSYTSTLSRPYRYNYDYRYDIPDYRRRVFTTTTTTRVFPLYTEIPRAVSVPRYSRAASLESDYGFYDSVSRARRAVSRARMMSEEPSMLSIKYY